MKRFIVCFLSTCILIFICACGKKVQLEVPIQQEMGDGVVECTLCYGEKEYLYISFMNHTTYPLEVSDTGVLYQWIDEKWKKVTLPKLSVESPDGMPYIKELLEECAAPNGGEKTMDAIWNVDVEQLSLEKGKYQLVYDIGWSGLVDEQWVTEEVELNFEFEIE